MLKKLALRNTKRNVKDYGIYFITLVFGVCVFYMFNSIYAQQAMLKLSEQMTQSVKDLQIILSYVSIVVAAILGFLIVYANSFFIKRRKKELGIYLILGMEKKDVSKLLIMETSVLAVVALVAGLVLGIFLSQFASLFTARIFEADMTEFAFVFSLDATMKSICYFCIIFAVVMVCNVFLISKYELIDLLQANKKNQFLKVGNVKLMRVLFFVSIVLIGLAYITILRCGLTQIGMEFIFGILCGGMGTLLFFYSLSGILITVLQKNKNFYFRNTNMFVIRQLAGKINTNFLSVSVVCIVLLFAIGIFATGYGLSETLSVEGKKQAAYDVSFCCFPNEENTKEVQELEDWIRKQKEVKQVAVCRNYGSELTMKDFGVSLPPVIAFFEDDLLSFVTVTDYNDCMLTQGKEEIMLEDDEYAIVTNGKVFNDFGRMVKAEKSDISYQGKKYKLQNAYEECLMNGYDYIYVIFPDKDVKNLECPEVHYNINCRDEEALSSFMDRQHAEAAVENANGYYIEKEDILAEAIGNKAVFSFLSIYLGIVFIITCAAILAIQQLTEAEDNKERYALLRKLGVPKSQMYAALFTQILCYFAFPMVLSIIHAIFGLKVTIETLQNLGDFNMVKSSVVTALFVLGMYVVYFYITYMGSKRIIQKG